MSHNPNLVVDTTARQFWVFVNSRDYVTKHNLGTVGSFCSTPPSTSNETLMFVPNPSFGGFVSPFQNNLMRHYIAEYNLELGRRASFLDYPCRLQATFLLECEADAIRYKANNAEHVKDRPLVSGITNGPYIYSRHDSAWVSFLRLGFMMSPEDINNCTRAYWSGHSVQDCKLSSCGQPWTQERATEILFLGRIDFEKGAV